MREKLARWLRTYKLNEVEVYDQNEDGIIPWEACSQEIKNYWLNDADQVIAIVTKDNK